MPDRDALPGLIFMALTTTALLCGALMMWAG